MDVIYQGDSGVVIEMIIKDEGRILDLTGTNVEVLIRLKDMGNIKAANITDAVNGKCEITLYSDDIIFDGIYSMQATVYYPSSQGKFTSNIQRFTVEKKMGYIPSVTGGNGSTVGSSATNGNIKVNGAELQVYNDTTIKADITNLKAKEHSHSNVASLDRIGINELGKLTIDNVELPTGGASVEASTTNGNIKVNGTEFTVFDASTISTSIFELQSTVANLQSEIESLKSGSSNQINYEGGSFTTSSFDKIISGGSFTN